MLSDPNRRIPLYDHRRKHLYFSMTCLPVREYPLLQKQIFGIIILIYKLNCFIAAETLKDALANEPINTANSRKAQP